MKKHTDYQFFMVSNLLAQKYDLYTACVFGRINSYAQNKGYCFATHETIAADIHLSKSTVDRRIDLLIKEGFIIDKTPDLRNHPHHLVITKKISFLVKEESSTDGVEDDNSQCQSDTLCMSQRHTAMSYRPTEYVTETHNEIISDNLSENLSNNLQLDSISKEVDTSSTLEEVLAEKSISARTETEEAKKPLQSLEHTDSFTKEDSIPSKENEGFY